MKKTNDKKKKTFKYLIIVDILLVIVFLIIFFFYADNIKKEKEESVLRLELYGEVELTLIKGSEYKEPGYIAYDSIEGILTDKVIVTGDVDTTIVGNYEIKYKVSNSKGKTIERTRKVNVIFDVTDLEVDIDYNPKELTNRDVVITIKLTGEGYQEFEDFNNEVSTLNEKEYVVNSNGYYSFNIKRKDGKVFNKSVSIENIDKDNPTGSCINKRKNGKSEITVDAKDEFGIKNYEYKIDGDIKEQTTNNTYIHSKSSSKVSVIIYDNAGNSNEITCSNKYEVGAWPIDYKRDETSSTGNYYYEGTYGNNNYILYYPKELDLKDKNPLVIFLGGGDEIGSNINLIRGTAFGVNMKKGIFKDAIYLLPQCRTGWEYCLSSLRTLIDDVVKKYNVDNKRISIMGHSHGAVSTYQMIARNQNYFSAAAILSGNTERKVDSNSLKNIKIVVYYGDKDSNITAGRIRTKILIDEGVNLKYIELKGEGHPIQGRVINGTDTIEWLIAQQRK